MNDNDTPMMKQYKEIKEKIPDSYLFFRCGDFYEMFYNDAIEASKILDITLTKRGEVPMCGVPYHSVDIYLAKIIKSGKKIAICEQMEDPKFVKGIVKRDITQILTPGTLVEEKLLTNNTNNYLSAINKKGNFFELCSLDFSTGDFDLIEFEYSYDLSVFKGELFRIMPKEILIPEDIWINEKNLREILEENEFILINRFPRWYFENNENKEFIFTHFNINKWEDLNLKNYNTDITTPGTILKYVKDNARGLLNHIKKLNFNNNNEIMLLDETTIKNLEITKNLRDQTSIDTLLEVMDDTSTNMGARLLRKWLIQPLVDIKKITKRQQIVDFFYNNQHELNIINKNLKNVMDIERLCSRIVMNKATPKDLISIKLSLISCNEIHNAAKSINILNELFTDFNKLEELIDLIERTIKEEPATFINEGNIVKESYSKELDDLKEISLKSKEYINKIEHSIKTRYNVPTLRVKYNKVLGYFFEVSKLQSKNIDNTFILRQSLVNTYRYTTKELSEYESKILTVRDDINAIEEKIFYEVKDKVLEKITELQDNAKIIAIIDVLISFSKIAIKNHYKKPELNESDKILIKEGRHPVVEQKLGINEFIPNNLDIDNDKDYLLIITGPNMSGKSTYLRQNALIVLMAQIGSFVPAEEAVIGIVDRIFTRIGTSDNLARGQSTFLVEMMETANILKNSTKKSFIIMDEIGRGTSTYDGLSIAWAVLEYIHNKKILGAKTLFATHFHELTELSIKEGIKNLSIAISKDKENITFLHKIIEEPSQHSYGIYVANLAHLPEEIIYFAEGILKKLEDKKNEDNKIEKIIKSQQLTLFDYNNSKKEKKEIDLINEIKFLDINRFSPIDALNYLYTLHKKLNK